MTPEDIIRAACQQIDAILAAEQDQRIRIVIAKRIAEHAWARSGHGHSDSATTHVSSRVPTVPDGVPRVQVAHIDSALKSSEDDD